jgi:transposase
MSLKPRPDYTVPEDTAKVARAIYPQGNLYMKWYDTFGPLFDDEDFADLFSHEGQPALSPVRLALVCMLQFVENLTDRQAAEAVRCRIDIKYLLCLQLTDPGFDHTVLSEFRARLIDGSKEQMVFSTLLTHFQEHDLLADGVKQRTDSTHVCGAIRALSRIECVGEAMRYALNTLALVAPDLLFVYFAFCLS